MIRVSDALRGKSKVLGRKNPFPRKFNPLVRWGETYTYAVDAARNQLAMQRLKEVNHVYGRIARIEMDSVAIVDVILKRYNPAIGNFVDHPAPVLAVLGKNKQNGTPTNSVGDQVILKRIGETASQDEAKNYENLHVHMRCGDVDEKAQGSALGGIHGYAGDPDLNFQKQVHAPKRIEKLQGHYQPHGSSVFHQNRMSEHYSNIAAVEEMRGSEGIPSFRGMPLDFQVFQTVHYAGYHVCPFHKVRTSQMEYLDPDTKYPTGKLNANQVRAHNTAMREISTHEWQPELYHEVNEDAIVDIELTHNAGAALKPRIESRRAVNQHLNQATIYEPNLNVLVSRFRAEPEHEAGAVKTVPNQGQGNYKSGVRGGAYYETPVDYVETEDPDHPIRIPLRAKWTRDIVNMSNRDREKRPSPEFLNRKQRMRT